MLMKTHRKVQINHTFFKVSSDNTFRFIRLSNQSYFGFYLVMFVHLEKTFKVSLFTLD